MFEKKSEEYASNVFNPVQEKFFITSGLVQGLIAVGFKDGATFGYNKAKEEMQKNGLALQSDMDKTIEQNIVLKEQIEKLKCCENCKYKNLNWQFSPICEARDKIKIENPWTCKCDKWEIKENE